MRSKMILTGAMFLVLLGFSNTGIARVDVNIGINPPPLVISSPPEVFVIPGTYVYYAPDAGEDLFFYAGYWYRGYRGNWYRSADYNGPWVYVAVSSVPSVLISLPPDYRTMAGYRRIPYGELRRNWKAWSRDRYWEKHAWWKRDLHREREHGAAPQFREQERRDFDRQREMERHDYDRHRERD